MHFRRFYRSLAVIVLAALSAGLAAPEPSSPPPQPQTQPSGAATAPAAGSAVASDDVSPETAGSPELNYLIVTVDTLRADHLGCYGYGRDTSRTIDALAQESVFFELALTPMATTLPAHLSLFTSTQPLEHGVLANVGSGGEPFISTRDLRLVAEVAAERGWHTAAFVSAAPVQRGTGIEAGFVHFDDPTSAERKARETTDLVVQWLRQAPRPFFLWVHYFDPHEPYAPPIGYAARFRPDLFARNYLAARQIEEKVKRPTGTIGKPMEWLNAYDGEIAYTDHELGRLFATVKELGLWDATAIVLTADHGEGLGEHGMAAHGYIWREQLHVPLMMRIPGVAPRRVSEAVSLVDVLPTLFGLVDDPGWSELLAQSSGFDVLAEGHEPRAVLSQRTARNRADIMSKSSYALALRDWKYMVEARKRDRLFHWKDDPLELEDVVDAHPELASELKGRLIAVSRVYDERGRARAGTLKGKEKPIDPELVERLRSLGYFED